MFDFQKLEVYTKSREFCLEVNNLLKGISVDRSTADQLKRASLSIMLNIAEGSSRFTNKDRKYFLIISRGSAFECVAIFEFLLHANLIDINTYNSYFAKLEEISKMLFGLIRKIEA